MLDVVRPPNKMTLVERCGAGTTPWSPSTSSGGRHPSPLRRDARTLAFYVERAAAYASSTWALPVDDRLHSFATMAPAGSPILDVGCGSGRDLAAFRAGGRQAIGLDRSADLARVAAVHSSAPVIVADLREAPFAPRSLAGVWASASLLHLSRAELPDAVAALAGLLVAGGLIFLSLKTGEGSIRADDGRLFTLHTRAEVDAITNTCGLRVVDRRVDLCSRTGGRQGWISVVGKSC